MKLRYACALLAPLMIASGPAAEAGNLRGFSLPGSVPTDTAALRQAGTSKKLLKTIFRNKPDFPELDAVGIWHACRP